MKLHVLLLGLFFTYAHIQEPGFEFSLGPLLATSFLCLREELIHPYNQHRCTKNATVW